MRELDFSVLEEYLPKMLAGARATIVLASWSLLISTLLALPLAIADVSLGRPVRTVLWVYSWVARGVPELVILLFVFLGLPQLGIRLAAMPSAILAFVFFSTAYNYEIIRAGFHGVHRGQYEAARALGLPYFHSLRRIILPQVQRIVAPAYLTNTTTVVKRTAIASVITVEEITSNASRLISAGAPPFALMIVAGTLYVLINSLLLGVQAILEARAHSASSRRR